MTGYIIIWLHKEALQISWIVYIYEEKGFFLKYIGKTSPEYSGYHALHWNMYSLLFWQTW